ncbi:hypothetical protein M3148_05125 [Georgenia satyanarayanai]|uniref:hypothetical protein n=1 Tax=Georgenia satyanarayanai TaxID=860221 RepID=UPI0020416C61|nr:hypothetical protein [Georgenia satyanarayanai]MCM3660378.1 hypothetical protein [Georgenia satyanarayanai]
MARLIALPVLAVGLVATPGAHAAFSLDSGQYNYQATFAQTVFGPTTVNLNGRVDTRSRAWVNKPYQADFRRHRTLQPTQSLILTNGSGTATISNWRNISLGSQTVFGNWYSYEGKGTVRFQAFSAN